jgi:outer membrane protein assembly factor BamB
VILQIDLLKGSFLLALDLDTGQQVWRSDRDEIPSWGTPLIHEGPGRTELVTNAPNFVRGYDPQSGKELWRLGKQADINVPTPIAGRGLIFVTSAPTPFSPIYAIRPGASGDITLKDGENSSSSVAWSKRRGGVYPSTPILYGDLLYLGSNNGVLTAYKAESGERVYEQRIGGRPGSYTASPVAADGRLYFSSEDGEVFVIKAGPTYELLSVNQMNEPIMATPAISRGLMVLRTLRHVVAVAESGTASR